MQYHTEPERRIPVRRQVDVLIAGGGTAGFAAAIAAGRQGAETMMVERYGYPGGMFTGGFVWWCDGLTGTHPKTGEPLAVVRGILRELKERAEAEGALRGWVFEPEPNKLLMMEMMNEAGVEMLYHAWVVDVIKEGDAVKGLIVESKSGREAILADVVVDCTGDADVAFRAGVPCRNCEHWAGPALNYVTAVPDDAAQWLGEHAGDLKAFGQQRREQIRKQHDLPADAFPVPFVGTPFSPGEKEAYSNTLMGPGYDMADAADLSRLEFEGRKLIFENLRAWKERFPAGKGALIKQMCSQAGIRETRRIRGEYVLTADDILSLRRFDDVVTKSPVFWEYSHVFDVPYRSLIPVGVRGLLVAGRCISATRQAADATRIISTCIGMGQAAGTAAALAARNCQDPRDLDIGELQSRLRQQDVELDLCFSPEDYSDEQRAEFQSWFKKLHELYQYEDEW